MKAQLTALCAALLVMSSATPGLARGKDLVVDVNLTNAMFDPVVEAAIPAGVKVYFAGQPVQVERIIGPTRSSRRTSRGKAGIVQSCHKALANVLKAMGEQASASGANAIVNIKSNNMNIVTVSSTTFKCRLGGSIVNVALIGDLAVVK